MSDVLEKDNRSIEKKVQSALSCNQSPLLAESTLNELTASNGEKRRSEMRKVDGSAWRSTWTQLVARRRSNSNVILTPPRVNEAAEAQSRNLRSRLQNHLTLTTISLLMPCALSRCVWTGTIENSLPRDKRTKLELTKDY